MENGCEWRFPFIDLNVDSPSPYLLVSYYNIKSVSFVQTFLLSSLGFPAVIAAR